MYRKRFAVAYILIALYGVFMLTAATVMATRNNTTVTRRLPLIANSSSPAAMDRHFNQHPWTKFPATTLGLPDGTCYVYGNKVSWIIMQCFGAQPGTTG